MAVRYGSPMSSGKRRSLDAAASAALIRLSVSESKYELRILMSELPLPHRREHTHLSVPASLRYACEG